MPTLNINGKRVTVGDEFLDLSPDEQNATVEEIARSIEAQAQAEPRASIVEDIGRSALSGLRSGVEGIVGAVGSTNKTTGDVASWIATKLGAGEDAADMLGSVARRISTMPMAPTVEDIGDATDNLVGERYQPETTAGEFARTIGEFAPNAIAGPGGAIRKTAMAVVPAIASEAAGQIAERTGNEALEPYARFLAAIGAGVGLSSGAAGLGKVSALKEAAKGAPTREALKQQTDEIYAALRGAEISYDPNAFNKAIIGMAKDLRKAGLRGGIAEPAFAYVGNLADDIAKGFRPDFDDINAMAQQIGSAARKASRDPDAGPLQAAYEIIRDGLVRFERTAPMTSGKGLTQQQANQMRTTARKLALQNIKARALNEVLENADAAAGREAGIRNGIRSLVKSKRGKGLFRGAERDALLEVANGRKALQTLSRFGFDLFSGNGNATLIPTLGAFGTGSLFGTGYGAGVAAIGTAAKLASPKMTENLLEQTSAAIRSGKLNSAGTVRNVRAKLAASRIRALLSTESGKISAEARLREKEGRSTSP